MNLLQIITPPVNSFYILIKTNILIPISGYKKIDITFAERKIFKGGIGSVIRHPVINYHVKLNEDSKDKLGMFFRSGCSGSECTLQTRKIRIKVGNQGYVFDADIMARPDMKDSSFSNSGGAYFPKICLRLENTDIDLFEEVEDQSGGRLTRFDLLDI